MSKHYIKKEHVTRYQQLAFSLKVYENSFDILKVVSSFDSLDDFNKVKELFKKENFNQPKIQVNLGEKMKVTRVLNKYMLPVF
jgi:3-dehydroquinate dehydratase